MRLYLLFVYLLSALPYVTYDLVGEKRETVLRELSERRLNTADREASKEENKSGPECAAD